MPPESPAVAGVLLAAGRSTRMGRPKQLLPLAGEPLVRHAALALAGGGHAHLLAVVPPGDIGRSIRGLLADLNFAFAENPDPARGLASSFRAAVSALPPGLAANFALADMPLVTAGMHRALLDTFAQSGAPVILAEYGDGAEGVRAPPHLFRADLLAGIADAPDADQGPRALIAAHRAGALTLRFAAAALLDVDTPADLERAQAALRGG